MCWSTERKKNTLNTRMRPTCTDDSLKNKKFSSSSFSNVDVVFEVLHHTKSTEAIGSEDSFQLRIANRKLFILWIVEIAFFDDCPHSFDHLVSGHFVFAHDCCQLWGEFAVLGETSLLFLRHYSRSDLGEHRKLLWKAKVK